MERDLEAEMIKKRQKLQLVRLRRLIDVVYALVIWRAFTLMPKPTEGEWSWAYAIKNQRLLSPDMTKAHAHQLLDRSMAEPITAIITIPIAFVGPIFWEISWLSYLIIAFLLKRRRSRQKNS